jgi:predicted O-methyltransferase YrrM
VAAAVIEGWFDGDEGAWYRDLAATIPAGGVLVEVGAWKGRSASYVGPTCTARGVDFAIVDDFSGSRDRYAARYAERLAREDVRGILEANLRALGVRFRLIARPSVEAARPFAPASVDVVFVDASHDRESVRADLDAWASRVRPGGILAGHDFSTSHPELVDEVVAFCARRAAVLERGPGTIWFVAVPAI